MFLCADVAVATVHSHGEAFDVCADHARPSFASYFEPHVHIVHEKPKRIIHTFSGTAKGRPYDNAVQLWRARCARS